MRGAYGPRFGSRSQRRRALRKWGVDDDGGDMATAAAAPNGAAPRGAAMPPCQRVAYVLQHCWQGDAGRLSYNSGVSEKDIRRYASGKEPPSEDVLRRIGRASNRISSHWLLTGEGPPNDRATLPLPVEAPPAPPAPADPGPAPGVDPGLVKRLGLLFGRDAAGFATAAGVTQAEAAAVLAGREAPGDAALEKVMESRPGLSLDWLLSGQGDPYPKPAPAPAAADDPLTSFVALLEEIRGFRAEVAGLRVEFAAVKAEAGDAAALARGAAEKADVAAASAAQSASVAASVAAVPKELSELRLKVNEGVETAAARAVAAASQVAADLSAAVDSVLARPEAVPAEPDGLRALLDQTRAELAAVRDRVAALEPAPEPAAPRPLTDAEVAAAYAREPDLPADAVVTVSAWYRLAGAEWPELDGDGMRRLAGRRMRKAYARHGLEPARPSKGLDPCYPVHHLRLYGAWTRDPGSLKSDDGWLVHFQLQTGLAPVAQGAAGE